ncbi:hypothetical protein MNBD_BACTEROID07-811 [hydrothermal vent metagenome]|uniref:Uncharacterized protein n=1 Tax=hydrothermal vent metagenome TaxID=652676 RepID=A0A3B0UEY7_9ZZZZ
MAKLFLNSIKQSLIYEESGRYTFGKQPKTDLFTFFDMLKNKEILYLGSLLTCRYSTNSIFTRL